MEPILYFLRSTEQKIVTDMLHYAYRLDEGDKKVQDFPDLEIYHRFYGLSSKDLGLYALSEHKIAGAAWIRLLSKDDKAEGYIDEKTPILTIAVKPEFRSKGIGSAMLEQLFLEAGSLYEKISVSVDEDSINFFKKHGFEEVGRSKAITMIKELPKERVVRPTDGYDPQKWMD
jgi:ribosomal protein S18 acetylase RimI-like enzyme